MAPQGSRFGSFFMNANSYFASERIAFLYDFLMVRGGAENVALHVSRAFPETDMVFGFIDRELFSDQLQPAERFRSLTSLSRMAGWQGLKVMRAFRQRAGFISRYGTVIYSGSYAPLAIRHHPGGRNIYYCHTPPRFVYDLKEYYRALARPWQRPLLAWLQNHLQPRYEQSIKRMDLVLANSNNVRHRLRKYLGLEDVSVLYPPVDVNFYEWLGQGDFYLSTARLEPYKRVELIVRAFMEMPNKRLIVAGGGSQLNRLKQLSAPYPNIECIGWCSSERMKELIGHCIATVYIPLEEDFGMSPVESMAAGKPVIGVAQGGLLETVEHGATGFLIEPDGLAEEGEPSTPNSIREAVAHLDAVRARSMRPACEQHSQKFGPGPFNRGLAEAIGLAQ
jgi:glycosyltransferase involved in cell wall biosynthesis